MATLTITWTPASPAPVGGYRVKYWPQNNPTNVNTVTPNVTGNTVTITGLLDNVSYQGTVESICEGGSASTPIYFLASADAGGTGCLDGEGSVSAIGSCGTSDLKQFTLAAGYAATISVTGFFYSGSGVRTATADLLDNSNNIIQTFVYTQTGTGTGSVSPSSYQISTAGIYKIRANAITCSNGSGTINITAGNCQVDNSGGNPTVTNAVATIESCNGDDMLGGTITLSGPVSVNTPFQIEVEYHLQGGSCASTQTATISGTVLANQSTGSVVHCSQGSMVPLNSVVCSAVGTLNPGV